MRIDDEQMLANDSNKDAHEEEKEERERIEGNKGEKRVYEVKECLMINNAT